MLSCYLFAHGVKIEVIAQLAGCGLGVGPELTQKLFQRFLPYQQQALSRIGKFSPPHTRIAYDHVTAYSGSLGPVSRALRFRRREENPGSAAGLIAMSIGGIVGVGGIELSPDIT